MPLYEIQLTGDDDYPKFIKALIAGPPGSGKGLPLDTPVLTPAGWTPIGELEVGDEIIGSTGMATTVTHIFDRGVQPCFEVTFNDGASIICDADHLWSVQTRKLRAKGSHRVVSTAELAQEDVRVPRQADHHRDGYKYWIPVVAPVEHDKNDSLPVDPYLLGVLLANGSLQDSSVIFSTNDEEIASKVINRNPQLDIKESTSPSPHATTRRWRIGSFKKVLRGLGIDGLRSSEKFVPEEYLVAHEDARRDLLAGLMDCDGSAGLGNRRAKYHTTSPYLRDAVISLVRSLGGVCPSTYVDERDENPCFTVKIELADSPFTLQRKASRFTPKSPWRAIASITEVPSQETRCIKVDAVDELFVTKDYIVTHNTLFSSTAPKPFMLSAEGGTMSIYDRGVPYITIEKLGGVEGMRTLITTLRQEPETRKEQLGIEAETFIIDTIDEVARLMMKEHLQSEGVNHPRIQDFGWLKETLTGFVRAVRNLDMHVIMTCHLKSVSDGDGGPQKYLPAIDGSFAEAIAGYVDLAFILRNDLSTEIVDGEARRTVNRWLQTYPEPLYDWIKDRSGKLPQQIAVTFDSDFQRIADAIYGPTDPTPPEESAPLSEAVEVA